MMRRFFLALLLAGCASSPPPREVAHGSPRGKDPPVDRQYDRLTADPAARQRF
jgi:hypothetical protein